MNGRAARFRLVALALACLCAAPPAFAQPALSKSGQDAGKQPAKPEISREERLNRLFERLGRAKSPDEAKPLASAIETLWLRSGSDTVDLLMTRAVQVQRGDSDAAIALLDKVVSLDPDFAEGWNRRAMVFFIKKDYRRAMLDIKATLAREPRHYGAWMGLARILEEFGMDKRALDAYRKVLAVNPAAEGVDKTVKKLSIEVEGREI